MNNEQIVANLLEQGMQLTNKKRFSDAINLFDQVLEKQPYNFNAWMMKAAAYYDLGSYDRAINCYDKAQQFNPNNILLLLQRGKACLKIKKYDEAIISWQKILSIDPNFIEAWTLTGITYIGINSNAEAINAFDKALTIDPKNKRALAGKAAALEFIGHIDEANNLWNLLPKKTRNQYMSSFQQNRINASAHVQNKKGSFCTNCGTKIESNYAFCINCGTKKT